MTEPTFSFLQRFNRPYTEIVEWYYLTEYMDYSNKIFTLFTIIPLSEWQRLHD